jgi:hypothetical protein
MASTTEVDLRGGETGREMPDYIRALPAKLQAAWQAGTLHWNGERLEPKEPVVTTNPGKSLADLIARQG